MSRCNVFLAQTLLVLCSYLLLLYLPSSSSPTTLRLHTLSIFGAIYIVRHNYMARCLLPRDLGMAEITFVSLVWIPSILASFAIPSALTDPPPPPLSVPNCILSIFFYVLGSWLNTFSEYQRKLWKSLPSSAGRCYTLGLFSLSRNINYFGEVVLFAAWAAATPAWWNVWVPVLMGLIFVFHHIPDKEKYLLSKYGEEFGDYQKNVKSFVPFLF